MGTKNNPGNYDCYENAEPNEPMFVLLGRDKFGASLVQLWAEVRDSDGEAAEKVAEARLCATEMLAWLMERGKEGKSVLSHLPFAMLADELQSRGARVVPAPQEGGRRVSGRAAK